MLKVLAFMKQVATGLQMEGNFGTAHVYRSSLNAIIAYRGKKDFVFSEVTSEWLKDRKSTRLNSSHLNESRMPSSA